MKLQFESRHLPVVPFYRFSGDASHWPEFTECFYTRVPCKSSFDDNIRMTHLVSVLDGEAKKAIETVGTCCLFFRECFENTGKTIEERPTSITLMFKINV